MAVFASAPQDPLLRGPDPQDALIQAVQAGDAAAAARQLQRWVHRRGHASLEPLVARIASLQGPAAADWLRQQLEQPVTAGTASAAVPPPPAAVVVSPPEHLAPDASVAAAEPVTDPESTAIETEEEPVPTTELPPPSFELPSFELPAFDPPAVDPLPVGASDVSAEEEPPALDEPSAIEVPEAPVASDADSSLPPLPREWSLDLEAAFPPLGTTPPAYGSSPQPAPASDPIAEHDDLQETGPAPASPRRGAFARMKSLVRGYLDEARDAFHRLDASGFDGEEEEELFEEEDSEPQLAPPAHQALPPQPAQPQIPSFLADGATAAPGRAPESAAPAPSALSDLRSWLPEADDQLPRAS